MPEPEGLAAECAVGVEATEAAICSNMRDISRRSMLDCSTGANVKAIHHGYPSSCSSAKQTGQVKWYAFWARCEM